MNDNEIMITLRRCADNACYCCTEYGKEYCRQTISALAWDLMYRQSAELDDLKRDTIPKLRCSLERANKYGAETDRENRILKMEIANAKAEARKECAKEICEEIIKRFDRLLKAEPNRGTTTSAKDFLEAHLPYVINSILKGITEDAGK